MGHSFPVNRNHPKPPTGERRPGFRIDSLGVPAQGRGCYNRLMDTKARILAVLREHEPELKALGVRRCGLFGSFVRGEQTGDSDIDVLVEFEPGQKTFDHFIQLASTATSARMT